MNNCKGSHRDGIYNCFGEYDQAMCRHCIYNEKPDEGETSEWDDWCQEFIDHRDILVADNPLLEYLPSTKEEIEEDDSIRDAYDEGDDPDEVIDRLIEDHDSC